MWDWWEVIQSLRDEWRCASITPGAQCVMTCGTSGMQKWSADSLDCQLVVIHHFVDSCVCLCCTFWFLCNNQTSWFAATRITLKSNLFITWPSTYTEMYSTQWITLHNIFRVMKSLRKLFMHTVLIASCSVSLHGITTLESSLVRLDYYQTHGLAHGLKALWSVNYRVHYSISYFMYPLYMLHKVP